MSEEKSELREWSRSYEDRDNGMTDLDKRVWELYDAIQAINAAEREKGERG